MDSKLNVNTKLFGFDGVIGRHDYFLNMIILASISLIFVLPFNLWFFSHIETAADTFNFSKLFFQAPLLLKIFYLCGNLVTFVLFISNLFRRLNDISGKNNLVLNIFISLIFLPMYFCVLFPTAFTVLLILVGTILGFVILLKKGNITGQLPYDYTKEFNWGAYLGTWIWGLVNKSYKTLWFLIVGFTPWNMFFSLYCGLKGNEWAFKNKNWQDVKAFNKAQEKQTLIFAILFFVLVPVIYFIVVFSLVSFLMFSSANTSGNNQSLDQTQSTIEDKLSKFGSLYFTAHLITPDENKYYVSSSDWKGYGFKDKKDILDLAASLASIEREKEYKAKHPDKLTHKSFSKSTELTRTKIYSQETKQLLGEFYMNEDSEKNTSFKDAVLDAMNAYRFYNAD